MSAIAIKLLAVASILVFMTIHVVSVEGGGKFQTIMTAVKLLPFVLLIGVGAFYMRGDYISTPAVSPPPAGPMTAWAPAAT